jgi:peptide-methionine (S)-S-oxide reductase
MAPISSTLALGAGCYWGTEKFIVKDFQSRLHPGCIANAKVGFMSPDPNAMKNPSYRQVCSGSTGHVEVLNIELTPEASSTPQVLEDLIKFFFTFHDPTTLNRQGNDAGTQYASMIFCTSPEQKAIAERVKTELQMALDQGKLQQPQRTYQNTKVETAIVDYTTFYEAHEEHQEYLMKNPLGYCNHRYRFQLDAWPMVSANSDEL